MLAITNRYGGDLLGQSDYILLYIARRDVPCSRMISGISQAAQPQSERGLCGRAHMYMPVYTPMHSIAGAACLVDAGGMQEIYA